MAKIKLTQGGGVITEGKHVFRITDVDQSKYEDFGRVTVNMVTEKGQKHSERFSFIKNDGSTNEGAVNAFSVFAKYALHNFNLDEIDFEDIEGCYIGAEVTHRTYTNKDGEERIAANLGKYSEAFGFGNGGDAGDDLDDLL